VKDVKETALDPLVLLRTFGSLARLAGMYPAGHPMIVQKLKDLDDMVQAELQSSESVQIDVIHDNVHLDGTVYRAEGQANEQMLRELRELGIDSLHIDRGVARDELHGAAEFLWQLRDVRSSRSMEAQLAERGIRHVTLGRLVPLDTRWRTQQWPEEPTGPMDPAYEEALVMARSAFESIAEGRGLDAVSVRDLVQLLIYKVAKSSAALGQILAVKQYENLTYCHSVNVAMLSLLLGRRIGLDEPTLGALVEAALLHDVGKTRVPLDVLKKPAALDKRERRLMEAHTTYGAEILVEIDGLMPLTPTVALEHHRTVKGRGYPDLGDGEIPHFMSQIVSVADIYEAVTGARSYQDPALPEQACLILARLAGEKLNTALVKMFVNAITFFPVGSVVRTDGGDVGVVVRTTPGDPLHPVIVPLDGHYARRGAEIDTSLRDDSGSYRCHVVETLRPEVEPDLTGLLAAAPPAAGDVDGGGATAAGA
jgi:putative nucleotidyltransferase with HDIG domain